MVKLLKEIGAVQKVIFSTFGCPFTSLKTLIYQQYGFTHI